MYHLRKKLTAADIRSFLNKIFCWYTKMLMKLHVNKSLIALCSKASVHIQSGTIRRGYTGLQKQTVQLRSTSEKFDFKTHCVLCAEEITDSHLEAQTKKEIRQRNIVHKVELDSVRDSFLKAAETRGDHWGEKIITSIKDQDLTAKDARYHLFCQRKLYRLPSETEAKRGYRPARNIDEAMEYIYSYLEEKSEECQFSMEELLNQIQGEFYPDIRTVKNRLFQKKYGEDIVIAETCNQKCTACFRNLGKKILTKSWYDNKKSDPQEEKLRVVKAAANIILGDIALRHTIHLSTHHLTIF
ncbi:hypothetical protein AVEN_224496-1 [Araneus ventricosus]|uniref:Uncharacterized protein n=1 Tax=Araneus ventricosus TaxID=182803 RepID=A0A4Y2L583_ARAVE|nr:hypothetical protein AVEN_224496-1 [Araneus ventricosus]